MKNFRHSSVANMKLTYSFIAIFGCSFLWQSQTEATGICVRAIKANAKKVERLPAGKVKKRRPQNLKEAKSIELLKYTPLYWGGEKEKNWLKVQDMSGRNLLIQKKDVSFRMRCISVHVGKTRLRQGPGSQFERAAVAVKGDSFLYLGSEDGWIQVMNLKGEKAWMNLDHSWRPLSPVKMKFEPESVQLE